MPLYTYRREDGTTFDYRQKFLDDPLTTCPTTGQSVVRVVQAAGIIFKGSGFYVTDNKSAAKNGNGNGKNGHKDEGHKANASESSAKADSAQSAAGKTDEATPVPEKASKAS